MRGRPLHLVRRAWFSVRPARPLVPEEVDEVRSVLGSEMADLFDELDERDQRHSYEVLRSIDTSFSTVPIEVRQAALMHDIGKANLGMGFFGRVLATLLSRSPLASRTAAVSSTPPSAGADTRWRTRLRDYWCYEELGALRLAELHPPPHGVVIAWAREHHLGEGEWSIPVEWGWALQGADNGVLR